MHNIETLDKLLQNELSAMETYQLVLNKLQDNHQHNTSKSLILIYEDHRDAVSVLQTQIRELGGTPAQHPSVWHAWSKIVQTGAQRLGFPAVLAILHQGEMNGSEDYQNVLWNPHLLSSIRCLIEWKLLLVQKSHTRVLDRLLSVTQSSG